VTTIYKSDVGRQAIHALYRRALQQWPIAHGELRVPTCHGETFVIASGDPAAPALVVFHGSGANSSTWIREAAAFSRDHRVYAVDMIGEPGFSAEARPPLASDAYARWLDDVWNALGITRASIVGISLGGWLAVDYAVRRPQRVRSLSLISPSGIGRQNNALLIKAAILLQLGERGRRHALRLVTGSGEVPQQVAEFVLAIFSHFRPRLERLPLRTDEELAALAAPVQLILGGSDRMIRSAETRERMKRLVKDLRVTWLEEDGHMVGDQSARVLDFLRTLERSRAPSPPPPLAEECTRATVDAP
jgi:pimeloyl-ACP methyl ester carboxylesterase